MKRLFFFSRLPASVRIKAEFLEARLPVQVVRYGRVLAGSFGVVNFNAMIVIASTFGARRYAEKLREKLRRWRYWNVRLEIAPPKTKEKKCQAYKPTASPTSAS